MGGVVPNVVENAMQAVFDATLAFHHHAFAAPWQTEGIDAALSGMCVLLVDGLRPAETPPTTEGARCH